MGCVSSKGFRSGTDRVSWYSRMSRNVSSSGSRHCGEGKDHDHYHVSAVKSSSYGELDEQTCHGGFVDSRKSVKQYKLLPPDTEIEEFFTFTSSPDMDYTRTEPATLTLVSGNTGVKPVGVQSRRDKDVEKKHFLMRDYLNMQHMVVRKESSMSLWEDEGKGHPAHEVSHGKNYAAKEWLLHGNDRNFDILDENHVGQSEGAQPGRFFDEKKSHDTEIINMEDLMEGLEDTANTPSPSRAQVCGTLSIPQREISFNTLSGFPSAPSDSGSPVWKKYYMQDVVSKNTWNIYAPAPGSLFNESPRRASSQSPFNDVDDIRSVSSMEVLDVNAIGLKILLTPVGSSFHPSPVNRAPSAIPTSDGDYNGSCLSNATVIDGFSDDAKSPYRSRKPSMESMSASTEYEHVGSDVRDPFRSPNLTGASSSLYGSESPLFDTSLMATFEEALKASTCFPAYDDWPRFSTDESLIVASFSAKTLDSLEKSMSIESTSTEQVGMSMTSANELKVNKKANLASYNFRCPPRGESKVVLYFTSLRGVRKTYEDCFDIRLILRGLGIHVDERDVWMHVKFRAELNEVLDGLCMGAPKLPQLFIKGRYIGGAEVIKQLHEEGVLSCLMEGLAMGLIYSRCKGCGDARFIPCFTCNGSRKVINEVNQATLCLLCNENGLIMCPICNT